MSFLVIKEGFSLAKIFLKLKKAISFACKKDTRALKYILLLNNMPEDPNIEIKTFQFILCSILSGHIGYQKSSVFFIDNHNICYVVQFSH